MSILKKDKINIFLRSLILQVIQFKYFKCIDSKTGRFLKTQRRKLENEEK